MLYGGGRCRYPSAGARHFYVQYVLRVVCSPVVLVAPQVSYCMQSARLALNVWLIHVVHRVSEIKLEGYHL